MIMFNMMLRIRWKVAVCRIVRTHWQNIQKNEYVKKAGITVSNVSTSAAVAVHLPTVGTAVTDCKADSSFAGVSTGFGVKRAIAHGIGNGVIAMQFSSSNQLYRKKDYDREDEHAIDRNFNNPLQKYMDPYDNQEKASLSLEEIAREQRRKIKSMKRARAAKDFKRGPEKRSLSWDTIQQIHYLRQENPDEWSIASLAESFNASEEVIAKVLRSKFRPSAKAVRKQDSVAAENTGYVHGGAIDTHALVASGPAGRPTQNEGKESTGKHDGTRGFGHTKVQQSNVGRNKNTVLKNHPASRANAEQCTIKTENHDRSTPFRSTHKEESKEDVKGPEVEFTIGDVDFENVDNLMGQVKLKPGQVFRKGRNFYNEHGEFLYRI